MLGFFGIGFGILMVTPELTQFLAVGLGGFVDQRVDGLDAIGKDLIAPVFGAVMTLDRLLALAIDGLQRRKYGIGIARA